MDFHSAIGVFFVGQINQVNGWQGFLNDLLPSAEHHFAGALLRNISGLHHLGAWVEECILNEVWNFINGTCLAGMLFVALRGEDLVGVGASGVRVLRLHTVGLSNCIDLVVLFLVDGPGGAGEGGVGLSLLEQLSESLSVLAANLVALGAVMVAEQLLLGRF